MGGRVGRKTCGEGGQGDGLIISRMTYVASVCFPVANAHEVSCTR